MLMRTLPSPTTPKMLSLKNLKILINSLMMLNPLALAKSLKSVPNPRRSPKMRPTSISKSCERDILINGKNSMF